MITVLVVHASRMGSTTQIASAVEQRLRERGLTVVGLAADTAPPPAEVDAVVIGSALYMGRWLPAATSYLRRHRRALTAVPVWLFHSGPCGQGAASVQVAGPGRIRRLAQRIGCAPPVTFGGLLDPARAAGPLSRWMTTGPYAGDYRDWARISAWADGIADRLEARSAVGTLDRPVGDLWPVSETDAID